MGRSHPLTSPARCSGKSRDPVIADVEVRRIARTAETRKLQRGDPAQNERPVSAVSSTGLVRLPRIAPVRAGGEIGRYGLTTVI